jgi:hypothetical protein
VIRAERTKAKDQIGVLMVPRTFEAVARAVARSSLALACASLCIFGRDASFSIA